MVETLREFDTSIGRCIHCGKLVFKDENWVIPSFSRFMERPAYAHNDCEIEQQRRASYI
jgi:phage FluMu protein Com